MVPGKAGQNWADATVAMAPPLKLAGRRRASQRKQRRPGNNDNHHEAAHIDNLRMRCSEWVAPCWHVACVYV
jgi:hypothetical protein